MLVYLFDSTSIVNPILGLPYIEYTSIFVPLATMTHFVIFYLFCTFTVRSQVIVISELKQHTCSYTVEIFRSEALEQTLYSHTRTHETAHSTQRLPGSKLPAESFSNNCSLFAQRSYLRNHSQIFISPTRRFPLKTQNLPVCFFLFRTDV